MNWQSIKVVRGSLNYIMMCNDDSCTTNLMIACNNEGFLLAIRGVPFPSKYKYISYHNNASSEDHSLRSGTCRGRVLVFRPVEGISI